MATTRAVSGGAIGFRAGLLVACLLWACCGLPAKAAAPPGLEALDELPPGERYRRLSLLMLVTGGVETDFIGLLETVRGPDADADATSPDAQRGLALDDFLTSLVRIVDQESLRASAAGLFRHAREHAGEIRDRLSELARNHPLLIGMVDLNAIAADAIVIRNEIANSVEYDGLARTAAHAASVDAFREQTIRLRNMMEYNQFERELARITEEAIVDLGGRLDAYERMFEEDIDPDSIRRKVESAEIMGAQGGNRFDDQAAMRNKELLMMLILMESQVR